MKQLARKRNLITLPLIALSLVGASLPATAAPDTAIKDMTSKLEYCKQFGTKKERRECLKRVRQYCVSNYSPEFCKQVFQAFKKSQMDEPKAALPISRLD